MSTPDMRLLMASLALCVTMGAAFAPLGGLPTSPCAVRVRRTEVVGLRAARSTVDVEQVSRRDLGRAMVLLGGTSMFPTISEAKMTKATAEDTISAWNALMDAKDALNPDVVGPMVESKDWSAITELLGQPEFEKIEDNLLKLVNGPILNADDKKTIGTRKRYGIAADVIYGVGGVKGAIENLDNPQIESCKSGTCSGNFVDVEVEVPKSLNSLKASLSEVLQICKAYKEFVRSN